MKKNKKGFTLVELVIVVAVMAVLIAVAIPTVTSITKTAKETVADTNARTIESTLKLAEANKNKDGNTLVTLTGTEIVTALTEAKLGIEGGAFVYDSAKGTVVAAHDYAVVNNVGSTSLFKAEDAAKTTFLIVYNAGTATVTPGTK